MPLMKTAWVYLYGYTYLVSDTLPCVVSSFTWIFFLTKFVVLFTNGYLAFVQLVFILMWREMKEVYLF